MSTCPYYFNIILGNIACGQANLLTLGHMISELPEDSIWSVGGIGEFQLKANALGVIEGGGVRIGLEDNIFYDKDKKVLATNTALIHRILDVAKIMGRIPYSHREARKILGLASEENFDVQEISEQNLLR